jgi:hypothetical protein
MAEYDLGFKLRQDGSINFDAYRPTRRGSAEKLGATSSGGWVSHCSGMPRRGLSPKQ